MKRHRKKEKERKRQKKNEPQPSFPTAIIILHMSGAASGLHLIVGPMCAGKTTALLQHAHRARAIGQRVLLVNHALDTRFGTSDVATHTHGEKTNTDGMRTVSVRSLEELLPLPLLPPRPRLRLTMADYDAVYIDELQFFDSPACVIEFLVQVLRKRVVAAGLVADYRRRPFGDVLPLIATADSVQHCTGFCSVCNDGTVGCFTLKKAEGRKEDGVVHVGGADTYALVCRKHYFLA